MNTTKLSHRAFVDGVPLCRAMGHSIWAALWIALLMGCVPMTAPIEEAVDLQNVPQDKGGIADGKYDYNDQPFLPQASHRIQAYEWLGPGVSEETAPKPADDFDDGLVVVNPSGFRPKVEIVLAVNIRTSFAQNPGHFSNNAEGRLAIWIDWDYNHTFVAAEDVYNQPINLPFQVGNMTFSQALVLIPVRVPENFVPRLVGDPENPIGIENPPIRARLTYNFKPTPPLGPGDDEIDEQYGEVEDHAHTLNDLAFYADNPTASSAVAALPPVLFVAFRNMLGKSLALMQADLEGQIVIRRGVAVADLATLVAFVADAQKGVFPRRGAQ